MPAGKHTHWLCRAPYKQWGHERLEPVRCSAALPPCCHQLRAQSLCLQGDDLRVAHAVQAAPVAHLDAAPQGSVLLRQRLRLGRREPQAQQVPPLLPVLHGRSGACVSPALQACCCHGRRRRCWNRGRTEKVSSSSSSSSSSACWRAGNAAQPCWHQRRAQGGWGAPPRRGRPSGCASRCGCSAAGCPPAPGPCPCAARRSWPARSPSAAPPAASPSAAAPVGTTPGSVPAGGALFRRPIARRLCTASRAGHGCRQAGSAPLDAAAPARSRWHCRRRSGSPAAQRELSDGVQRSAPAGRGTDRQRWARAAS